MSEIEFTSSAYYRFLNEHKVMGTRCLSCSATYLPPRPLCPACHGEDMEWIQMRGKGQLQAYTSINIASTAMIEAGYGRDNPYCTGIVQVDEGPSISAQIIGLDMTHPEQIAIGSLLKAVFVERGQEDERQTYLAFEPA